MLTLSGQRKLQNVFARNARKRGETFQQHTETEIKPTKKLLYQRKHI